LLPILDFGQQGSLKLKKTLPHANGFKVTGKLHKTIKVKSIENNMFFLTNPKLCHGLKNIYVMPPKQRWQLNICLASGK